MKKVHGQDKYLGIVVAHQIRNWEFEIGHLYGKVREVLLDDETTCQDKIAMLKAYSAEGKESNEVAYVYNQHLVKECVATMSNYDMVDLLWQLEHDRYDLVTFGSKVRESLQGIVCKIIKDYIEKLIKKDVSSLRRKMNAEKKKPKFRRRNISRD